MVHGQPPAEWEMARYFRVSPPTVHQMIIRFEQKGFIQRVPGAARSIRLLVSQKDLPDLKPGDTT